MRKRLMSFRHVEAFRAVIAAGSMTAAAQRLHTSQPQVSRLIAQLEAITGLPLFERAGGRLAPTLDGMRFSAEVERAFVGLSSLEAAAVRIRSFGSGRLRVAAMPRLAGGLLARAVARFKTEHQEVAIAIHSGGDAAVSEWIATGFCDVALTMIYGDATDPAPEHVLTMDCVAVLPPAHPLAALERLEPADFHDAPFIASPLGSTLRTQIDAVFEAAGVEPIVSVEAGLGASICVLVAAGLGMSLMNPLAAYEEAKSTTQRRGSRTNPRLASGAFQNRAPGPRPPPARRCIEIRPFVPSLPVRFALLFPPDHARSRLVETFSKLAFDEPQAVEHLAHDAGGIKSAS